MIPYANLAATMLCPALTGKMTVREIINHKVKTDGKFALTKSGAKLTGNGLCAILTAAAGGSPQPCQCKVSGTLTGWRNVSQNTACGSPLLLQISVNQCSVGGVITIINTGQHKVKKDISVSVPSIESLTMEISHIIHKQKTKRSNRKTQLPRENVPTIRLLQIKTELPIYPLFRERGFCVHAMPTIQLPNAINANIGLIVAQVLRWPTMP